MDLSKGEKNEHNIQFFLWVGYALLSAVFAALTSILAKLGISGIDSNLATAIRTVVVLVMAWGIVFYDRSQQAAAEYRRALLDFFDSFRNRDRTVLLFYYRALQLGDASKVVPIDKSSVVISMILAFVILKEKITWQTLLGGLLITAGTFVLIL